jgi:hypothetical protein
MEASLEERGSGAAEPVFLIDGFPRNLDNLDGWVSEACQTARAVLFFECAEETLEQRLLERGKTSGRSDDNLASIKKRFKTFQSETMPVVEIFEGDGTLHKIQAEQVNLPLYCQVQSSSSFSPLSSPLMQTFPLNHPCANSSSNRNLFQLTLVWFGVEGQSVEDVFRQVEKVLAVAVPDLKRR